MNRNHKNRVIKFVKGYHIWQKSYIRILSDGRTTVYIPDTNNGTNYHTIGNFFKDWTILDRRVLIEKAGFYI